MNQLTIFYDSKCPLCNLEMQKLKQLDGNNHIILEDLHQPSFDKKFPAIDKKQALSILHGVYQGNKLTGIDVTYHAWRLVGKGWMVFPLKLPIVKQLAQLTYQLFARYRHPIANFAYSRLGIGHKSCRGGICYDKANNTADWRE